MGCGAELLLTKRRAKENSLEHRTEFTTQELELIRELLRDKSTLDRDIQKGARRRLRKLGFYISDFGEESGFGEADLDSLLKSGRIRIVPSKP
jgi:hypothetical protein